MNKQHSNENLINRNTEEFKNNFLHVFDNSSLCVYVIEPDTYKILYSNKYLSGTHDGIKEEVVCYRELVGNDMPCDDCPMKRRDAKGNFLPVEKEQCGGLYVLAQASEIQWEGKLAYLIICTDLSDRKKVEESLRIAAEENAIVIKQSGKKAMRYGIDLDIAENMLDRGVLFGLSQRIENYSRILETKGIIASESFETHRKFIEDIRKGKQSGSCNVLVNKEHGKQNWIHFDYSLVHDRDGKPIHAIISGFDDTDFVEKELAYDRWRTDLNALLAKRVPYMEANISKDIVERQENLQLKRPDDMEPRLSLFMKYAVAKVIASEDCESFNNFFNTKRMLAKYFSGVLEDSLQYRATFEGKRKWYRADLKMVKYPYSEDIKAFFTFHDIDDYISEKEILKEKAHKDAMTNLLNRVAMQKRVEERLKASKSSDSMAMFVVDMDRFKSINDTYGHQQGDKILIKMGNVLRQTFRGIDLVGRVGGDEFMMFMSSGATEGVVQQKARQLLSQMQFMVGNINTSASIGIAISAGGNIEFEKMYAAADKALYKAKNCGRNTFCMVDGGTGESLDSKTAVPEDAVQLQLLLKAMEGGIIMSEVDGENITIKYTSPSLQRYAAQMEKEEGATDNWLKYVHPEDWKILKGMCLKAAADGSKFDMVFRLGSKNQHWMRICGERMEQQEGENVRLLGVLSEMTRFVQNEIGGGTDNPIKI